jgi:hypothetical protein
MCFLEKEEFPSNHKAISLFFEEKEIKLMKKKN